MIELINNYYIKFIIALAKKENTQQILNEMTHKIECLLRAD